MALTITPLPTPVPQRSDPTNFAVRADALLTALPDFATETNALAAQVEGFAATCESAAQVSAVTLWVSGTTYAVGSVVYDPVDFLTYRRKTAGAGTTRPGLDATNWALLTGFGDVTTGTNQTITGVKTFTQTIQGTATGVTTSGALTATAGASYSAVGTYVMASSGPLVKNPGETISGSFLYASNALSSQGLNLINVGTWRCMGRSAYTLSEPSAEITLWLRIA